MTSVMSIISAPSARSAPAFTASRFGLSARALRCLPIMLMAFGAQATASNPHADAATTLWRCASASGEITYSQRPCADHASQAGQTMQLKDDRSRAQQRASMSNQLRDVKLARQMHNERLYAEHRSRIDKPISMSGKGKPHVIRSTPNDHRPVPISDSTRPIKVKAPKTKPGTAVKTGGTTNMPTTP